MLPLNILFAFSKNAFSFSRQLLKEVQICVARDRLILISRFLDLNWSIYIINCIVYFLSTISKANIYNETCYTDLRAVRVENLVLS